MRGGISGIGKRKPRIVRDWSAANEKVEAELHRCRNWADPRCHTPIGEVERAHIIGRQHDVDGIVIADRIIPLCRGCHDLHHRKRLDLLPLLTKAEQVQAVADAGGILTALELLVPSESKKRT